MSTPRSDNLTRWLEFLNIADCPCSYAWKGLGRLYGISMGSGWVRMETRDECRHHGIKESS